MNSPCERNRSVLRDHHDHRLLGRGLRDRLRYLDPLGVLDDLHLGRVHEQERHHHRQDVDEWNEIELRVGTVAHVVLRHAQRSVRHAHGRAPRPLAGASAAWPRRRCAAAECCGRLRRPGCPAGPGGAVAGSRRVADGNIREQLRLHGVRSLTRLEHPHVVHHLHQCVTVGGVGLEQDARLGLLRELRLDELRDTRRARRSHSLPGPCWERRAAGHAVAVRPPSASSLAHPSPPAAAPGAVSP